MIVLIEGVANVAVTLRVTLTRDGVYNMTFFTTGKGPQSHDGIHPEMLREVFGVNTGLYRALRASA
jgi:hypothetical protein